MALPYAHMCANYVPVTRADRLSQYFGVVYATDAPDHDVWPGGGVPFIRLARPGEEGGERDVRFVHDGIFRFVPNFISTMEWARNTYNARCETVRTAKTFKRAWADGHRCIIPAEAIYEYNHGSGEAVRWRIQQASGEPMGIAGIYTSWVNKDGELVYSLGMLTVNADDHPFMKQFHAPGDEKRMVVILDPRDYEGWLKCDVAEAMDTYCRQWHGELTGGPAPLPGRTRKPRPPKEPPVINLEADLLGPAASVPKPAPAPRTPARNKPPPPAAPPPTGDLFE